MSFHPAIAHAECGGACAAGSSWRCVILSREARRRLPPLQGILERVVSLHQHRRRRTQRSALRKPLDSWFAKPIGALLLLGLLYLALKIGLIAWVVAHILAPIGGDTITADELYRTIKDKS